MHQTICLFIAPVPWEEEATFINAKAGIHEKREEKKANGRVTS